MEKTDGVTTSQPSTSPPVAVEAGVQAGDDEASGLGSRSSSPIPAIPEAFQMVKSSLEPQGVICSDGSLKKHPNDHTDYEWAEVKRSTFPKCAYLPGFGDELRVLLKWLKQTHVLSPIYFALKNLAEGVGDWAEEAKKLLAEKCLGLFNLKDITQKDEMVLTAELKGNPDKYREQWNAWVQRVNILRSQVCLQYVRMGLMT